MADTTVKEKSNTAGLAAKKKQKSEKKIHGLPVRNLLLIMFSMLLVFGVFCFVCSPKQYDLTVGSISHETIKATKDVVDEVTFERKREAAADAVDPIYSVPENYIQNTLSTLDEAFGKLQKIQEYGKGLLSEAGKSTRAFTEEELSAAAAMTEEPLVLSEELTEKLMRMSDKSFSDMVTAAKEKVSQYLNDNQQIREADVPNAVSAILKSLGSKGNPEILEAILNACIGPSMILDEESTRLAKERAMDAITPTIYLQGRNLVQEGEPVTESQYAMLLSLGLVKNNRYDLFVYGGAALIVLISFICLVLTMRILAHDTLLNIRHLAVCMIVILLSVMISAIVHLIFNTYITPVVFAPILLTMLLGIRVGFSSIIPLAILNAGVSAGSNSSILFEMIMLLVISLSGGVISVFFIDKKPQRVNVLLAGFLSSIVNIVVTIAIKWMTSSESLEILNIGLWALISGLLSGTLTITLQPAFEALFHLATPSRLLELTNPNQPLLRRLMLEAPGTYHHSIIVANLAEAAAQSIGANQYLARAAGYYHDIGKLQRPGYFKENQMGENPHDKVDPYVSSAILTAHTRDGYLMAQKNHLPHEMIDIILQHHGDTPVMFFYHKALQMSKGNPVDINEFRYAGPRPQTREAAVVMLADTIEAAVRSMPDPTPKAIDQFIERLVRGKLEDGQLSDSPLSLKDIDDICSAFSSVLRGVFHERIEYPEVRHHVPPQGSVPEAKPAAPQNPQSAAPAAQNSASPAAHAAQASAAAAPAAHPQEDATPTAPAADKGAGAEKKTQPDKASSDTAPTAKDQEA